MQPANEKDLITKMNLPFNSSKDLLDFFEKNRFVFNMEAFDILIKKLIRLHY